MIVICSFIAAFFWFSPAGASSENLESTAGTSVGEMPSYSVPKEKADHWEKIRGQLKKEKEVCKEHCGAEAVCLDRCRQAYKTRLDREYKQLMHE